MISSFGFSSFRSFQHEVSLSLAPITLLYGQNSAGKSSALKALLFLKANLSDSAEDGVIQYSSSTVDLGSALSLAHMHRTIEPTTLGATVELGIPESLGGTWPTGSEQFADGPKAGTSRTRMPSGQIEIRVSLPHEDIGPEVEYRFLGLAHKPSIRWSLTTIEDSREVLILKPDSLEVFRMLFGNLQDVSEGTQETAYEADSSGEIDLWARPVMRAVGILPGEQIGTFSGKFKAFNRLRLEEVEFRRLRRGAPTGVSWEITQGAVHRQISREFRRVRHVGPARRLPDRVESSTRQAHVREVDLLAAIHRDDSLRTRLNNQLAELQIEFEVLSRHIPDPVLGDIYSLELRNRRTNVVTALTDVGYGVSQILPVILESFRPGRNIVLIEQPELHLHPALQARLGDLFISGARGGIGNRFVIETHSEAIMLRILRRIRERRLPPEAVQVLYVDQDEDGVSGVKKILIDENGEWLSSWPHGFFEERIEELIGQFEPSFDSADRADIPRPDADGI